jgi:glycosyltransferase involved in cell wall biosynthesis
VIAIPLKPVHRVAGLTSLIDALALGKPVLCSRNSGLDIDIEAIGCGLWIEPGDPSSWSQAITRLLENPKLLSEMGARGRAYAEHALRMDDYGARLTAIVYRVLGKKAPVSSLALFPPRGDSPSDTVPRP